MNRWRIQFFSVLILALLIIWPAKGEGVQSNLYAFAIRYGIEELAGIPYQTARLDQFDTRTDKIVESFIINPNYNSAAILDEQNLVLCDTSGNRGADVFSLKENKTIKSFDIDGKTPQLAVPAGDKIFIITYKARPYDGRFSYFPSFEIFDRQSFNKIRDIDLRDGENINERVCLSRDRQRLYFIGWNSNYYPSSSRGLMGAIDAAGAELYKQIDYSDYFGGGRWVANCGNKLYATAVNAESKQDATGTIESKLNDRLFVFSADDLSLLKTVPIGILAEQLTYVPAVNRLYIAHSSMSEKTPQCIEVLDCEKDKVITKIDVQGFRRMSYVGNHKLYVSCSGGPVFGSGGKGGLLVIDVRNNKIIKKIPGEYAPIAYNFNATEEAK